MENTQRREMRRDKSDNCRRLSLALNTCRITLCLFLFIVTSDSLRAQDTRSQYPKILSNAYFGLDIGYINYPFDNSHLKSGYVAEGVDIPQPGVRLTLFGYHFNKNISARITYMRPTNWVEYKNINGDKSRHSVWMNFGGLTVKAQVPLAKTVSVYAETGLGIVTRNGFEINNVPVVADASYASILASAGFQYHFNRKWQLVLNSTYSPSNSSQKQPYTWFHSLGFQYNMQPLSEEKVKRNSSSGYIHPKKLLQIGVATNALGYGVNHFLAEGAVPVFWGGDVVIRRGVTVNYQHNVFHTRKVFSLDWGTSAGFWKTRNDEDFFSLSIYPLLRFTLIRSKPADFYLYYSVAGPTFLSRRYIDDLNTGRKFTFRDFMGIGSFIGKRRAFNAEISIGHFSNGNVYPNNPGVKIPLTFTVGLPLSPSEGGGSGH